ncbi:hypothetical protein M3J09_005230 [Ascochyta lentis]
MTLPRFQTRIDFTSISRP